MSMVEILKAALQNKKIVIQVMDNNHFEFIFNDYIKCGRVIGHYDWLNKSKYVVKTTKGIYLCIFNGEIDLFEGREINEVIEELEDSLYELNLAYQGQEITLEELDLKYQSAFSELTLIEEILQRLE